MTKQCHACKKRTSEGYLSRGGRHYHIPSECSVLRKAITKQEGEDYPIDGTDYSRLCWDLANPEQSAERTTPKEASDSPQYYLLSCAQTMTPANMEVVRALETLAKHINAHFYIGALKYKNPNAWHGETSENEDMNNRECDKELSPWLVYDSVTLNNNSVFKVTTGATSLSPINMAKRVTDRNVVVAHPVRQQRPIATPSCEVPTLLLSTGSCTYPYNYSLSPAGEAAEFHHTYGAALVQVTADEIMMWPITYDEESKSVHWLDERFCSDGTVHPAEIAALILGDMHGVNMDEGVRRATQDWLEMTARRTDKVLIHDMIDFTSASHWNNIWTRATKSGADEKSVVGEELSETFRILYSLTDDVPMDAMPDFYVVGSNHNDHLDQWLLGGKNHKAPLDQPIEDLALWHYLNYVALTHRLDGRNPSGLQLFYENLFTEVPEGEYIKLNWLRRKEPYYIEEIDCSQHGDKGPSGARGSLFGFSRVGRKVFTGHGHSDLIEKGAWAVGTSGPTSPDYSLSYNTMQHSHGIIYKGGCRGKLPINNGRITLDQEIK